MSPLSLYCLEKQAAVVCEGQQGGRPQSAVTDAADTKSAHRYLKIDLVRLGKNKVINK